MYSELALRGDLFQYYLSDPKQGSYFNLKILIHQVFYCLLIREGLFP